MVAFKSQIFIVFSLVVATCVRACGWSGATEDNRIGNRFVKKPNPDNPTNRNTHWTPPPGTNQNVMNFIKNYEEQLKKKEEDDFKKAGGSWPEKPAGVGSDWPDSWKGFGPGYTGAPPPPWAYIKESHGKADMCFLPPNRGPCRNFVTRWGFNPYINNCAEYVYGGCGGTANRFVSMRRCREACVGVPTGNCVSGSDLILDTVDFPDIPSPDLDKQ